MITCTYDELCEKVIELQYDALAEGCKIAEVTIDIVDGNLTIEATEKEELE